MATLDRELNENHFRVAVYGSARIQTDHSVYSLVYTLAGMIAEEGMDIVTGGGPGLMDAASRGYNKTRRHDGQHSIGLDIRLPKEQSYSRHLDIKAKFEYFSERLDHFIVLSNAFVVTPGGIGTLLEFFYTWQLAQVRHIFSKPIILIGDMWEGLMDWMKEVHVQEKLIDSEDLDLIYLVSNCREAMDIIKKSRDAYNKGDIEFCQRYNEYKLKNPE